MMCDIITGLAQVLLFSLCQTVSLYPSLRADIVPGEMVIVMHESSAGVQDKHFICMLLPNKMTVQIKPLFGHVDPACRVCGDDGWKRVHWKSVYDKAVWPLCVTLHKVTKKFEKRTETGGKKRPS